MLLLDKIIPPVAFINEQSAKPKLKPHLSIKARFFIGHLCAATWMTFSVFLSWPWLKDLALVVGWPLSVFIIGGLAILPSYLNAFLVASLIFDRQPPFKDENPLVPVTILIAAKNEADNIGPTLYYLARQDYAGRMKVIVIDNASSDTTPVLARYAGQLLSLDVSIIRERIPGKFNALNYGLNQVFTDYVITLDADTVLHESAIRYLMARMLSAPDAVAVAGSVMTRNNREGIIAKAQDWDYFLSIAAIKRQQGMYQSTLVAQGAFSVYRTDALRKIKGWPDAIGEDIVLTWRMLMAGGKTYFEPLAISFTSVPTTLKELYRQRSRWARGMIEALRLIKPWEQVHLVTKYLTGVNLLMPYLDIAFSFFWIPGLILAFFGKFWVVGPMSLAVMPLSILSYTILYFAQKKYFRKLNLKVRKNWSGFLFFMFVYQILMSPTSVAGYVQELFRTQRSWK